MTPLRLLPLSLALGAAFAAPAQAQSLLELYESARTYDASYQSAKAQYDANLARAQQAKAGILPSANLSANASRTNSEVKDPPSERDFNSRSATVSAAQPLFRPAPDGSRRLESWVLAPVAVAAPAGTPDSTRRPRALTVSSLDSARRRRQQS